MREGMKQRTNRYYSCSKTLALLLSCQTDSLLSLWDPLRDASNTHGGTQEASTPREVLQEAITPRDIPGLGYTPRDYPGGLLYTQGSTRVGSIHPGIYPGRLSTPRKGRDTGYTAPREEYPPILHSENNTWLYCTQGRIPSYTAPRDIPRYTLLLLLYIFPGTPLSSPSSLHVVRPLPAGSSEAQRACPGL